jgi:hypothetical protein
MGDQIEKLKTNMGVKAVVSRYDDHDQETKGVYYYYKILHFVVLVYNTYAYRPLCFLAGKSL